VVLDDTASNDDLSRLLCYSRNVIDVSEVSIYINNESWIVERVKIKNISQSTVSECRCEDGNVVLVAPVVYALLTVW